MAPEGRPPTFLSGFLAPFAAVPYILVRPRLLGLTAAPLVLNAVFFVLIFHFLRELFPFEGALEALGEESGALDTTWAYFLKFLDVIVPLFLSAVLGFVLLAPLAAPFNDKMSELIEQEELATRPDLIPPPLPLRQALRNLLRDVLQRLLFVTPLLAFGFCVFWIPMLGPVVAGLLTFSLASTFYTLDAFSFSLDRRRLSFVQKLRWLRAQPGSLFPIVLALGLLLMIPCNVILLPSLATVAATRRLCAILKAGHPAPAA